MKVRFSVVAFVPPNAQLGVVGSAPFLGEWDVKKCLPLLPYSSPHASGQEPSLWFRDIDVPGVVTRVGPGRAAAANNGAARGGPSSVGDIAVAAALKREECLEPGCCIDSNNRDGGAASSGCNHYGDTSHSHWFYSTNGNRWGDRCWCECGTSLHRSSNCGLDNGWRSRSIASGNCSRITDSTRCTGSRTSTHSLANSVCVHSSRAFTTARGTEGNCGEPEVVRGGCSYAEDPTLPAHGAIRHTVVPVGQTDTELPGFVPVATTGAQFSRLCRPSHECDIISDTEFAWELLLAASSAQPGTRYAAVAAAAEGIAGNSYCDCQKEFVNNHGRDLPTAAGSFRDPWKQQTFQSSSRQPLQENIISNCEPESLYCPVAASPEHQGHQTEMIQAPLRRCCRRRDQALSSVEGGEYRGTAASAEEHSDDCFIDAAAAAGQQYSRAGFIDVLNVDHSRCMHAHFCGGEQTTYGYSGVECDSVCGAATYSIDPRIPAVLHLLDSHPLKQVQFEYKFILWYPPSEKAALPCFPSGETTEVASANLPEAYFHGSSRCTAPAERQVAATGGNCGTRVPTREDIAEVKARRRWSAVKGRRVWAAGMQRERKAWVCNLHTCNCNSSAAEENWRAWLFPPAPPRLPTPPDAKEVLVWEGTGPEQNRKFVFDPFDVVVDLNRRGVLQCLYICKVAHFRDPRAGGTSEYELTSRFYNSVRSESRMHFARICPGLYVGSCPRQLLHVRLLKEELKVTCIFNLQTEQDICLYSSSATPIFSEVYKSAVIRTPDHTNVCTSNLHTSNSSTRRVPWVRPAHWETQAVVAYRRGSSGVPHGATYIFLHTLHHRRDVVERCYTPVIGLCGCSNNYPDPMATARSAEDVSQLYDSQGLRYVWLPTADMRDSARKTACANAAFLLLGLIESGHCVYVHCNAGVGRSVAAVSAFLCFAVGLDLRKVNFLICAKRPVAFWDEKAMKYGLGDYTHKFGSYTVMRDTSNQLQGRPPFCCA